jgi:flagellar hook-associated protein 2
MGSIMFTGASRYAADFQGVIDRALKIAALPLNQMQSESARMQSDSAALSSLDAMMVSLESAIVGLGSALGVSSYSATSSDSSILTASLSTGVQEGSYRVTVQDFGAYAVAVSADPPVPEDPPDPYGLVRVTDPATANLSAASNYSLTIGGQAPISLTATTLSGLAQEIQSKAGDQVTATVVNIGSPDGLPNYKLSVQGRTLAPLTFALAGIRADDSQFAVFPAIQQEAGKAVSYSVNGAPAASASSRSITVATGVTLTLNKADPNTDVSISVTRSPASVKAALSGFIAAYNAAVDELGKHIGSNGGALTGDSLIRTFSSSLASLAKWDSGSGSIASLTSLGVDLGQDGKLKLNETAFATATKNGMDGASGFLGASATAGFLKLATDTLDSILSPDSGILQSARTILDDSISKLNDRMAIAQTRLDNLQVRLAAQMSAADALIAQMEQQATYFTNMFAAMKSASDSMQ